MAAVLRPEPPHHRRLTAQLRRVVAPGLPPGDGPVSLHTRDRRAPGLRGGVSAGVCGGRARPAAADDCAHCGRGPRRRGRGCRAARRPARQRRQRRQQHLDGCPGPRASGAGQSAQHRADDAEPGRARRRPFAGVALPAACAGAAEGARRRCREPGQQRQLLQHEHKRQRGVGSAKPGLCPAPRPEPGAGAGPGPGSRPCPEFIEHRDDAGHGGQYGRSGGARADPDNSGAERCVRRCRAREGGRGTRAACADRPGRSTGVSLRMLSRGIAVSCGLSSAKLSRNFRIQCPQSPAGHVLGRRGAVGRGSQISQLHTVCVGGRLTFCVESGFGAPRVLPCFPWSCLQRWRAIRPSTCSAIRHRGALPRASKPPTYAVARAQGQLAAGQVLGQSRASPPGRGEGCRVGREGV